MPTAIRSWQLRSSSAHCDQKLAKRIGEKLGDEDWRGSWRRGLARRRKRRRRRRTAVIKSNNPHLRGGEKLMKLPPQAHLLTWSHGMSKLPAFVQRFLPAHPRSVVVAPCCTWLHESVQLPQISKKSTPETCSGKHHLQHPGISSSWKP